MSHKINLTFDIFTIQQPLVASIIKKCINATLEAEGVTADCEINVLVTNDKGRLILWLIINSSSDTGVPCPGGGAF